MPKPTKTNTPPKKRRRGEPRRAKETRRIKDAQKFTPKLSPSKKQKIPPSELKAPNDEQYSLKSPPAISLPPLQLPKPMEPFTRGATQNIELRSAQEKSILPKMKRKSVAVMSVEELQEELAKRQATCPPFDVLGIQNNKEEVRCNTCGLTFDEDMAADHRCPEKFQLKRAPVKPRKDYDSDDEIKEATKLMMEKELQSEDGQKYLTATTFGKRHGSRRNSMQLKLHTICVENREELGPQAELVEDVTAPGYLIPKCFISLGGEKTQPKLVLASNLLWKLFKTIPDTEVKEGDCPFLEPGTENTYLGSLLAVMKEEYDWRFSCDKDFKFEGGLESRLQLLRAERADKWPEYGTGKNVQEPGVDSVTDIDITVFSEEDNTDFQKKTLICFGGYLAFRGASEHAYLMVQQVQFGVFEAGHPLVGQKCVNITDITDKSHKLTLTNGRKRNTKRAMRLPVHPEDLSCPGGTLFRFKQALAPGQRRWYTYPATHSQKKSYAK